MNDFEPYLYLYNICSEVTPHLIYWKFIQAGPINKIRMFRDKCNHSLGYAFIEFKFAMDAKRALKFMKGETIRGNQICMLIPTKHPYSRNSGKCNLYVENIEKKINFKRLRQTFCQYGNVLYFKIFPKQNHKKSASRNYAFVHYEREESAQLAMEYLNGIKLRQVPIKVILEKDSDIEIKRCNLCEEVIQPKIITSLTPTKPSDGDIL